MNTARPQPFQYQGSKRSLAPKILRFLPSKMERLVEPFSGSAALSIACANEGKAKRYWLNDFNAPLIGLLESIVTQPNATSSAYSKIWRDHDSDHVAHFFDTRDKFNRTQNSDLLLYLLARCVKGAVRYNSKGEFNQSPDKRRLGIRPDRLRRNISAVSLLLKGKASFSSLDYREIFKKVKASDVLYMDPPYQGVCSTRNHRYSAGIETEEFVEGLEDLNRKGISYLVSYDGRLGDKSYGEPLPERLGLTHVELEAGRSSQATLLGKEATTIESLYLSEALVRSSPEEQLLRSKTHHQVLLS